MSTIGLKIYLYRFTYRGTKYLYTSANYDVSNLVSASWDINTTQVFTSINIGNESSFVQDTGFSDSEFKMFVDDLPPFNLITEIDPPIQAEVFELNNDTVMYKWSGIIDKQTKRADYELVGAGLKSRFKYPLPVLTVGPTCPFETYGPHCGVATTGHNQVIIPVTHSDRYVLFNIADTTAWNARQSFLGTTAGYAYENGYIEQDNIFITVEQQLLNNYKTSTTTTSSSILKIRTRDPFAANQKVELYSGLVIQSYATINSVTDDGTYKYLTFSIPVPQVDNINVHYFITKAEPRFPEYYPNTTYPAYAVEGDRHDLDHCRIKFANEDRFAGFINMPDKNPVINKVS